MSLARSRLEPQEDALDVRMAGGLRDQAVVERGILDLGEDAGAAGLEQARGRGSPGRRSRRLDAVALAKALERLGMTLLRSEQIREGPDGSESIDHGAIGRDRLVFVFERFDERGSNRLRCRHVGLLPNRPIVIFDRRRSIASRRGIAEPIADRRVLSYE